MRSSESGLSLDKINFIASLLNTMLFLSFGAYLIINLLKSRDTFFEPIKVERVLDILNIDLTRFIRLKSP